MTALPKFSLAQQIEAVRFAETRQRSLIGRNRSIKELRGEAVAEVDMQRLGNAARTLETLAENADAIRAFLKLPAEAREAVLQAAKTVDECWRELTERDDRTSPSDYPDMCLITLAELATFMATAALGRPAP